MPSDFQTINRSILKQNKYKIIELVQNAEENAHIVKTFRGHPSRCLKKNAQHTFQSLRLMRTTFEDLLWSPLPLSWHPEQFTVEMEYIPELVTADHLSLKHAEETHTFFERCYQMTDQIEFLPSIMGSVLLTNSVKNLIHNGFPLCLGFKGDLYENLRLSDNKLIFADTETMCLEPLGLSELVLYCSFFASPNIFQTLKTFFTSSITPVAIRFLPPDQFRELNKASVDFFIRNYLKNVAFPIRYIKIFLITVLFSLTSRRFFGRTPSTS